MRVDGAQAQEAKGEYGAMERSLEKRGEEVRERLDPGREDLLARVRDLSSRTEHLLRRAEVLLRTGDSSDDQAARRVRSVGRGAIAPSHGRAARQRADPGR